MNYVYEETKKRVSDRKKFLHNGDQLKQPEFHLLYCQMPQNYRAELIGGLVFEPSPVSYDHGKWHSRLNNLFGYYADATPGVELADNATVILSEDDEPQPDLFLRIATPGIGQSQETKDNYIKGAPELVAEIALSSKAIDLHLKKARYAAAGVKEYLVVCLDEPKQVRYFDLEKDKEITGRKMDVLCSKVFPGLWIDIEGYLALDAKIISKTLKKGLKTEEYKKFKASLRVRKKTNR